MRRYFYDAEFIEDGTTIELVSIGVVSDAGDEYYAVSTGFDPARAIPWVRDNVINQLPPPSDRAWRSPRTIRDELAAFLGGDAGGSWRDHCELWAWMGAYDHVVLCQLWGAMPALPRHVPRFTHELRQRWEDAGKPALPPEPADKHHALADARWAKQVWDLLRS